MDSTFGGGIQITLEEGLLRGTWLLDLCGCDLKGTCDG